MHLLAYWRWDSDVRDLDAGAGFCFNTSWPPCSCYRGRPRRYGLKGSNGQRRGRCAQACHAAGNARPAAGSPSRRESALLQSPTA
jgi:hypothetical protein